VSSQSLLQPRQFHFIAAALRQLDSGIPIQNTAIGSALNALNVQNPFIWSLASATYALNASGTASVVLTGYDVDAIWTLEQAIVNLTGVSIRVF
jgi:hypothetical protein